MLRYRKSSCTLLCLIVCMSVGEKSSLIKHFDAQCLIIPWIIRWCKVHHHLQFHCKCWTYFPVYRAGSFCFNLACLNFTSNVGVPWQNLGLSNSVSCLWKLTPTPACCITHIKHLHTHACEHAVRCDL